MNNKIVLYSSPEAASIKTLTGWVDRDGRYWGDNEHQARYCGATHNVCTKHPDQEPFVINWGCPACKDEHQQERFEGFERIQWDGETPVTMFFGDKYFFDIDEIRDHCEECGVSVDDLKLVLCEPNYPHQLDPNDIFVDILPEDGEVSPELYEAFEALNKIIDNHQPLSWSPIDKAVIVTLD